MGYFSITQVRLGQATLTIFQCQKVPGLEKKDFTEDWMMNNVSESQMLI